MARRASSVAASMRSSPRASRAPSDQSCTVTSSPRRSIAHAAHAARHALDAARVIDPRGGRQRVERALHVASMRRVARRRFGRCARGAQERVERGSVKAGVVERAAALARVEQRADIRERQIARDAGDEHVERASARRAAVVRNAPISVCRTRTAMPRAARSACMSCSATLSPLPTVSSSSVERTTAARASDHRGPAASPRRRAGSRRAIVSCAAAWGPARADCPAARGPTHGVPKPASATSTMRARSIDSAIGAADARVVERRARRVEEERGAEEHGIRRARAASDRGARAPPSSARCRPCRAPRSRGRRTSSSPRRRRRRRSPAARAVRRATAGNRSLRAKVQRAPRRRETKRNGPLPTGASLNGARAHAPRGERREQVRGHDAAARRERRAGRLRRAKAQHERRVVAARRPCRATRARRRAGSPWPDRCAASERERGVARGRRRAVVPAKIGRERHRQRAAILAPLQRRA